MNKLILNTDVQNFIKKYVTTDIMSVLLKKQIFEEISQKEIVQQLIGKKKSKEKLPTWFETPKIYYPKKLSIEQSSSEKTAHHKSQIVDGKSLLDLTGGFGVDSYFFSKKIDDVYYIEIDPNLAQIASHNFNVLQAKNVNVISEDGISFLKSTKQRFDWIYIDPSRRNDVKGKVFRLDDCSPKISEHLVSLFEKSDNILVKTSPLLDLSQGIRELQNVFEVHVVAVKSEVKELLWVLKNGFTGPPRIKTTNIKEPKNAAFDFYIEDEAHSITEFSTPLQYLYEPNAAILKSGAFKLAGKRFSLKKLHQHTHLYTSSLLIDFPGRRFVIENVFDYGKKTRQELNLVNANIAVRNFPQSVDSIRKNLKIKDGGKFQIFFARDLNNKLIVLKCLKLN